MLGHEQGAAVALVAVPGVSRGEEDEGAGDALHHLRREVLLQHIAQQQQLVGVEVAAEAAVARDELLVRRVLRGGLVQLVQVVVEQLHEAHLEQLAQLLAAFAHLLERRRVLREVAHVLVVQGVVDAVRAVQDEAHEVVHAGPEPRGVEDDGRRLVELLGQVVDDRARVHGERAHEDVVHEAQRVGRRALQLVQQQAVRRGQQIVVLRGHEHRLHAAAVDGQAAARLEEHGVEDAAELGAQELVHAVLGAEEGEREGQPQVRHREEAEQQLRVPLVQHVAVLLGEAGQRGPVDDVVLRANLGCRDVIVRRRRRRPAELGQLERRHLLARRRVDHVRVRPAPHVGARVEAAHGEAAGGLVEAPGQLDAHARAARGAVHEVREGARVRVQRVLPEEDNIPVRLQLRVVLREVAGLRHLVRELRVRARDR